MFCDEQKFPNSLWESGSIIFRHPEVRCCALVFQHVDNCSSVLVSQVTRMRRKSHLQGEGCRDSSPFFPKHPHTVPPPSLPPQEPSPPLQPRPDLKAAGWHLPLAGSTGTARQGVKASDSRQRPEFAAFSSPAPVPPIRVSWPASRLVLDAPLLALAARGPLPLLARPAPLAPSLPEQLAGEPPPRSVRVVLTPPAPARRLRARPGRGPRESASAARLERGGRTAEGSKAASPRRAGLHCASGPERSLGDRLDGRPRGTLQPAVRWGAWTAELSWPGWHQLVRAGAASWAARTPESRDPEEREPRRRKGVQGAQLLGVPVGAGGSLSHGSK